MPKGLSLGSGLAPHCSDHYHLGAEKEEASMPLCPQAALAIQGDVFI